MAHKRIVPLKKLAHVAHVHAAVVKIGHELGELCRNHGAVGIVRNRFLTLEHLAHGREHLAKRTLTFNRVQRHLVEDVHLLARRCAHSGTAAERFRHKASAG